MASRFDPDTMSFKLDLITKFDGDLIMQRIGDMPMRVMNVAEEQTRDALIKMGWSPPADDPRPAFTEAHWLALGRALAEAGENNPSGRVRELRALLDNDMKNMASRQSGLVD